MTFDFEADMLCDNGMIDLSNSRSSDRSGYLFIVQDMATSDTGKELLRVFLSRFSTLLRARDILYSWRHVGFKGWGHYP